MCTLEEIDAPRSGEMLTEKRKDRRVHFRNKKEYPSRHMKICRRGQTLDDLIHCSANLNVDIDGPGW